jgi:hypothetical protein
MATGIWERENVVTDFRDSADTDPPAQGGSCVRAKASAVGLQVANVLDVVAGAASVTGHETAAWVIITKAAAVLLRLIAGLASC